MLSCSPCSATCRPARAGREGVFDALCKKFGVGLASRNLLTHVSPAATACNNPAVRPPHVPPAQRREIAQRSRDSATASPHASHPPSRAHPTYFPPTCITPMGLQRRNEKGAVGSYGGARSRRQERESCQPCPDCPDWSSWCTCPAGARTCMVPSCATLPQQARVWRCTWHRQSYCRG